MKTNVYFSELIISVQWLIVPAQIWSSTPRQSPIFNRTLADFDCVKLNNIGCTCIEYEAIECPASEPKFKISITNNVIFIDCNATYIEQHVYNSLPIIYFKYITRAFISGCPLSSFSSNYSIFQHIGVQHIQSLTYIHPVFSLLNDVVFTKSSATQNEYASVLQVQSLIDHHLLWTSMKRANFSRLPNLQSLILRVKLFDTLPDDLFGNLPGLKSLTLSENIRTLPAKIFWCLPKLNELILTANKIFRLDRNQFQIQTSLSVTLSANHMIDNITSETFESLSNLTTLSLEISGTKCIQTNAFSQLSNLEQIRFVLNKFKSFPVATFAHSKKLSHFVLATHRMSIHLPDLFLANLTDLKTATFINCRLVRLPEDMFAQSVNIQNISFARNRLTSLPKKLFRHQRYVRNIDLSQNLLAEIDENCFWNLVWLDVLRLSNNKITKISR